MKAREGEASAASAAPDLEPPVVQVVGCTNPACNDHIGAAVAREIARSAPDNISVAVHDSHEFDVIADAQRFALLVLVQGVDVPDLLGTGECRRLVYVGQEAAPPGDLHELCRETGEPTGLASLCATLKNARERELLPDEVWIYAVGGGRIGGAKPDVVAQPTVREIARRIIGEVEQRLQAQLCRAGATGGGGATLN